MSEYSEFDITVTEVVSANRLLSSQIGINTHRTNRYGWAIILKTQGKTYYNQGKNYILSDSLHPVILPKGCDYSWKCEEDGEYIIIEFDAPQTAKNIFSFEIKDNSFIKNSFSKIEKCLNSQSGYGSVECKSLVYEIILFLIKSQKRKYAPKSKQSILMPAIDYITKNYYRSDITNDKLADFCQISTVYFRKTFELVYGVSPMKFLHNFRINKAKALLLSDYESIGQVAESVGYNSIYHFSKMFKIYTGISPSEFTKASQK